MCPRPTFYLYKGLKITAFSDSIFAIVILQYSNIVHFTLQLHLVKVGLVRVTIKEKMVNDIFSDHNSATKTCFVCKVCSQEHLLAFEKKYSFSSCETELQCVIKMFLMFVFH